MTCPTRGPPAVRVGAGRFEVAFHPLVQRRVPVPQPVRGLATVLLIHAPPERVVAERHLRTVGPRDLRERALGAPRVVPNAAAGLRLWDQVTFEVVGVLYGVRAASSCPAAP
jgi:hypothetical protein